MRLSDELYFEITVTGIKSELKKFIKIIKSGEFDDFFDISPDYIVPDDEYALTPDEGKTGFVLTNDDIAVEISDFNPEPFLEAFCRAGEKLEISGHLYDSDDEEFNFSSAEGSGDYIDTLDISEFNDELDAEAYAEEKENRSFS